MDKKPYMVCYDAEHFCDGFGSDNFEQAKEDAFRILIDWLYDTMMEFHQEITEANIDMFNSMIDNCFVEVKKYNPETDEYEEYWCPPDEELRDMGWMEWDENFHGKWFQNVFADLSINEQQ